MIMPVGLDTSSSVFPTYGGGQGDSESMSSVVECILEDVDTPSPVSAGQDARKQNGERFPSSLVFRNVTSRLWLVQSEYSPGP